MGFKRDVQSIDRTASDYPRRVTGYLGDNAPRVLTLVGDRQILQGAQLALICSVSCSGSVVIKTYDAIRELRAAGIIVAGGFHSPMEHECLDLLLRGVQPVVLCPAYGIEWLSLDPQQQAAVDSGRLLVLSIFGVEAMRATPALALRRIEFVAALAAAVFVPHPAPGGKAEATARQAIARGQEVKENTNLIELCAKPVDVRELVAPHVNDQHIRVE